MPFFLVPNNHLCYQFSLWRVNNNGILSLGNTGRKYTYDNRPFNSSYYVMPCFVQPGLNMFYLRCDSRGVPFTNGFMALSEKRQAAEEHGVYFSVGIFSGIFCLVIFFSAYLYFVSRERIHIFYMMYVLCAWLLLMSLEGYDFEFLYPSHPGYILFVRIASAMASTILLVRVMQEFTGQSAANSIFYRVIALLYVLCVVVFVLSVYMKLYPRNYTLSHITFEAANILLSAGFILSILSCIEKIRQGVKIALFYLGAIIANAITALCFMLHVYPSSLSPVFFVEGGAALEVMTISFGILYRYNNYRRQKEGLERSLLALKIEAGEKVLYAENQERSRIARDLHDGVSGTISGLRFYVSNQFKILPPVSEQERKFRDQLLDILNKLAYDIRNISHNLMANDIELVGLQGALEEKITFLNQHSNIVFDLIYRGDNTRLTMAQQLSVYRCISELIQNIVKHSAATRATVQALDFDDYIEFQIHDNGKGFEPQKAAGGIGLNNVQSRISLMNGDFSIEGNAFGTLVIFSIPLNGKSL